MINWFVGLLASVSSIFVSGANKEIPPPPLNMEIIAYEETYNVPAVADPGNFPMVKKFSEKKITVTQPAPVYTPPPAPAPIVATPPPQIATPTPPPAPAAPERQYVIDPEPLTIGWQWLNFNGGLTIKGSSMDGASRTLPEITFDREYWKVDVLYYWAPDVVPPKPEIKNNFFKMEVYEKGTDKLIYTMASGKDDSGYPKSQTFGKPGTYYFKVYTEAPSQWEITFKVSSKLAQ